MFDSLRKWFAGQVTKAFFDGINDAVDIMQGKAAPGTNEGALALQSRLAPPANALPAPATPVEAPTPAAEVAEKPKRTAKVA